MLRSENKIVKLLEDLGAHDRLDAINADRISEFVGEDVEADLNRLFTLGVLRRFHYARATCYCLRALAERIVSCGVIDEFAPTEVHKKKLINTLTLQSGVKSARFQPGETERYVYLYVTTYRTRTEELESLAHGWKAAIHAQELAPTPRS